jgi:tetratricopeptide (TPR) repeat protein
MVTTEREELERAIVALEAQRATLGDAVVDAGLAPMREKLAALPQTLGRRYALHEPLGAGGMGAVYRATDRLTGDTVALKRVMVPADQLAFASRGEGTDASLALAQEFRTLASLHHPHVIRVLDYGFDERRQPFYTMSLLENARTIVEAGHGCDLDTQVDLLVQALHALVYLHRRGILHRDLKSENVLVVDGRVKVLDFGLSVVTSKTMEHLTQTTAGTLAYMAPELFADQPVTRAADLYAVGVMAYELFAGRFPYNQANMAVLLNDILTKTVDVRTIGVGDELAAVLERLLVKSREARYADAGEVIRDLCAATGCSLPPETVEIRESYLQAARFVGRETELGRLSEALDAALAGRGSAWLVGGESGVGKSRLVDELRALALIKGALVLRGQAVSEGGSPYHLWRDVLRWLALTSDLAEEEASVLKPLVPDVTDLVGNEVSDAPSLDPQATQARLWWVVGEVLRRQEQAVVVILEDLQWAGSESLAMLEQLTRRAGPGSLLLVGDYRDDERPHLPEAFPGMQVLKLERLTEGGVAELSASMLGPAGRREPVVGLLQRETEGNPFFLVEVVRALAEEAGQLERVGVMTLPARVFAGGVRRIVQRRLGRVPEGARPLLQLAAVARRELELVVLRALKPEVDLERWLTDCVEVAVLEAVDERWRFAHDKLREGILDALPDDARPGLCRQVAAAIEAVYPGVDEHVVVLARHWERAGEIGRAVAYLRRAGEQAAAQFANAEAVAYLSRALDLMPEGSLADRYALLLVREKAYDVQGRRETQAEDLAALRRLANALKDDRRRTEVALRQANYAEVTSDYPTSIAAAQAAIRFAQTSQTASFEAVGYLQWGKALWRQGDYEAAQTQLGHALSLAQATELRSVEANSLRYLGDVSVLQGDYARARAYCEQALHICREIGDQYLESTVLNSLGMVSAYQEDYTGARTYFEQVLCIFREIGHRRAEAIALNNLGAVFDHQGDQTRARICYEQSLCTCREIGERRGEAIALNNLGEIAAGQGTYAGAKAYFEQSLHIYREIGDRQGEGYTLAYLALLFHHLENDKAAQEHGQQALLIVQDIGDRFIQGYALTFLGHAQAGLGHLKEAADAYQQALILRQELGERHLAIEPLAGLVRVSLIQGDLTHAQAQVEEILSYLETDPAIEGTEEPLRVYLTCYRMLRANQDPRAKVVLTTAYSLLQERAVKISDEALRRSFLENMAAHREIVKEWEKATKGCTQVDKSDRTSFPSPGADR